MKLALGGEFSLNRWDSMVNKGERNLNEKRGKVWLGVAAVIVNAAGHWLVVKKRYSGLKGKWSLPAGFVNPGETVDEAVKREVLEETGVVCEVKDLLGIRTGVIENDISDNMLIFACKPLTEVIKIQEKELLDVQWLAPDQLLKDNATSMIVRQLIERKDTRVKTVLENIQPGNEFGYTSYKILLY